MKRAYSPSEILRMKKKKIEFTGDWADAFGNPEFTGVWFIWGDSGNGKSSFVMQLCKELTKFGRVIYDSLEEGTGLTIQNTFRRFNMIEVNHRFQLLDCESMPELSKRMDKHKSPDFYIIDSFQYTQMSYKDYIKFKETHKDKLLIFISQTDGRKPDGRSAKKVMFDSALKIYVEGFRAFSKGRFFGPAAYFTIWKEGAERYWGDKY